MALTTKWPFLRNLAGNIKPVFLPSSHLDKSFLTPREKGTTLILFPFPSTRMVRSLKSISATLSLVNSSRLIPVPARILIISRFLKLRVLSMSAFTWVSVRVYAEFLSWYSTCHRLRVTKPMQDHFDNIKMAKFDRKSQLGYLNG